MTNNPALTVNPSLRSVSNKNTSDRGPWILRATAANSVWGKQVDRYLTTATATKDWSNKWLSK